MMKMKMTTQLAAERPAEIPPLRRAAAPNHFPPCRLLTDGCAHQAFLFVIEENASPARIRNLSWHHREKITQVFLVCWIGYALGPLTTSAEAAIPIFKRHSLALII